MQKSVYMDYAATTPVDRKVLETMLPYYEKAYGNPSSIHKAGRETKKALDTARSQVADAINADSSEVFFTSGGSESDNWAIKGVMLKKGQKRKRFITSKIEHHAVLHTAEWLENHGFDVVYIPVDKHGFLCIEALIENVNDDTALVSVMMANNEIGTIEHIAEYAEIAHRKGALFHTDAVQAVGTIPVDVRQLNVDLLSLSGHKFYGPKGVGALYVKRNTAIENLIDGGAQERGKRSGTENVPGIVGLGAAIELAQRNLIHNSSALAKLRDHMISRIRNEITYSDINGSLEKRLPGNINVSFSGADASTVLMRLDLAGICASGGSACTAGTLEPSHVLRAIGLSEKQARESVRFTLGRSTTEDEIDYVITALKQILDEIRKD